MHVIGSLWPVAAGICCLLLAAWQQHTTSRVSNQLIGVFLLGALATAGCATADLLPALKGGVLAAFAGLVVGGGILLPLYTRGGLGAGCVKAQAVFGAWLGCALPASDCVSTMLGTTIAAVLLTLATAFVWKRRAAAARQQMLFPAQITLSVGSLLALAGIWACG